MNDRDDGEHSGARQVRWGTTVWKFLALVVILAGFGLAIRFTPLGDYIDRHVLAERLQAIASSPWAPVVFIVAYGLALGLGTPASLFTLTGGVVFGVWPGALYNWLGTLMGASMAFVLARRLGRDFVRRLLRGRLVDLDEAVAARGFWAIFIMRLIPVIPFNLSNFAAGLTGIEFLPYLLATALAIAPGLTVVTWFAHTLWEGAGQPGAARHIAVASIALLATMALPWAIYHWVRRQKKPGSL